MIEGVYHSIKNENNLHNLMKGRALSELGSGESPLVTHVISYKFVGTSHERSKQWYLYVRSRTLESPNIKDHELPRLLLFHMSIEVRNIVFR